MLIISRTPIRISFFGGGTDYRAYYEEHGGAVLGTTIDQYTYISVKNFKSSFFEHNIRIAYSKTELVKAIDEIQHPSIREALRHKGMNENLDIHIFSDLPARSGLGSSSAFTVGFLNALYALEGQRLSKQDLAELACHVEQDLIQENVGSQDQFHAAFGGLNKIQFSQNGIQVSPLVISAANKQHLQDHFLIFFTGMTRHASEIVQEQIEKTKNHTNNSSLKTMHQNVFEAEKMLSSQNSNELVKNFGALLHENWLLKKGLSQKVSNPTIDEAYKTAMSCGAYGGKLCGAGNGGFLLFLAPPHQHKKIRAALARLQEVPFKFEDSGSSIIYMKD